MENRKQKEDLNHGIYSKGSTGNSKSHGCVQAILMSCLEAMKKWGAIEEVTIRCSYFERLWMLVVFWILDIRGPSSLGANTMQVGNLFGRGLIGLFVLMLGFKCLQEQGSFISVVPLRTMYQFGLLPMVLTHHLPQSHFGLKKCGSQIKGVEERWRQYGEIHFHVIQSFK